MRRFRFTSPLQRNQSETYETKRMNSVENEPSLDAKQDVPVFRIGKASQTLMNTDLFRMFRMERISRNGDAKRNTLAGS